MIYFVVQYGGLFQELPHEKFFKTRVEAVEFATSLGDEYSYEIITVNLR